MKLLLTWVEWLVAWTCRKLGIAQVSELKRLEEKLEGSLDKVAGDIGQLEKLPGEHESRIDDLVESLKNAEGDIEDLQKADQDLENSVEHHAGQIEELEQKMGELDDKADNEDLEELDQQLHSLGQWVEETNAMLLAVRELLQGHGVEFDAESLTWRESRGEKLGQICEALEVPSKELEDVLGKSKSRILLEYRLKKLEEFQAELSRIFRLPDSK